MTRMRIGHAKLTHGYPQPLCSQSQTILTIKHIIEEFPQYEELLPDCKLIRTLEDDVSD